MAKGGKRRRGGAEGRLKLVSGEGGPKVVLPGAGARRAAASSPAQPRLGPPNRRRDEEALDALGDERGEAQGDERGHADEGTLPRGAARPRQIPRFAYVIGGAAILLLLGYLYVQSRRPPVAPQPVGTKSSAGPSASR